MPKLSVFNSESLDGYFTGPNGDLSWAHTANADDDEWKAFVVDNAKGGGMLLMGRITYEMMIAYWPTPTAAKNDPEVAAGMNSMPKVVFSRTLDTVSWENTTLVKGDLVAETRKLKQGTGPDMVILGSGTIVSQLTKAHLIDEYQIAVLPVILGAGRTMFEGVGQRLSLKRTKARPFRNGNVFVCYEPTA
jgi:dihydrofolate reductase